VSAESFPTLPPPTADDERRSSEWDLRRGPRNYVTLVVAQGSGTAASVVSAWLATQALGPAGYGAVAAVLAASYCAMQVAVHWTSTSVARYGCVEFVETGRVARAFWTRLLLLIPGVLVAFGTAVWWLPPMAGWLRLPAGAYPLVLSHFLVAAVWVHVQQTLQAAKLPHALGVLFAVERGLLVVGLLVLVWSGTASPSTIVLTYVLAAVAVCAVALWRLRPLLRPGGAVDYPLLAEMVRFSLPLIPQSVMGYLTTQYLDAFFISRYLPASDLGIYWVAYQLAGVTMQLPLLAGLLLFPLFITHHVQEQENRTVRFLREVLPLLTLGWATACVAGAALGGYLAPLVFGPQYVAVSDLLWPLMLASALAGPALIAYIPISNVTSATYVQAAMAVAAAVVNVALNLLLIPRFGLTGCAWATASAHAAGLLVAAHLVHRLVPSSRGWTIPAVLPAVVATGYAALAGGDALGAMAITILSSGVIVVLYRQAARAGVRALMADRHRLTASPRR
jgi:O-antigen/teichoic acid export membrane protein